MFALFEEENCTNHLIFPFLFFKRSQSDALQEEAFLHDDDDDVPHLL